MKNFKETHQLLFFVFAKTSTYVTLLSVNKVGSDLSHIVKKGKEKGLAFCLGFLTLEDEWSIF
jgi:hypothetical protein